MNSLPRRRILDTPQDTPIECAGRVFKTRRKMTRGRRRATLLRVRARAVIESLLEFQRKPMAGVSLVSIDERKPMAGVLYASMTPMMDLLYTNMLNRDPRDAG